MPELQLFSAHFRPSIARPAVDLICQAIDVNGEKLLWVDGYMIDHPILVPISSVGAVAYKGTFNSFMRENISAAQQVLVASNGQHSPTLLARAVSYMTLDPMLSAEEALDHVVEEALDLIDVDNGDRGAFVVASQGMAFASHA